MPVVEWLCLEGQELGVGDSQLCTVLLAVDLPVASASDVGPQTKVQLGFQLGSQSVASLAHESRTRSI